MMFSVHKVLIDCIWGVPLKTFFNAISLFLIIKNKKCGAEREIGSVIWIGTQGFLSSICNVKLWNNGINVSYQGINLKACLISRL